jgi:hypothetical protein
MAKNPSSTSSKKQPSIMPLLDGDYQPKPNASDALERKGDWEGSKEDKSKFFRGHG